MKAVVTAGQQAEVVAARYLEGLGYRVRARNWKTRYCEIDIIAVKDQTVYFVEAKYRRTTFQGQGLDYITRSKLRRLKFAAEIWLSTNKWTGPYNLAAVEVSGANFAITQFIDSVST